MKKLAILILVLSLSIGMSWAAKKPDPNIVNSSGIPVNPATSDAQTDGTQKSQVVDGGGEVANIDSVSGSMQVINFEHHALHEGNSYEIHIDSANAAVATLNVAFKTLAGTGKVHMLFGWASNDEIKWEILEGATWTTDTGTVTTVYNQNRDSANVSTLILEDDTATPTFTATNSVLKDVSITGAGTAIDTQYTYNAGLGVAVSAESRRGSHEWLLNDNTTYVVRMTQTDGNCKMSIDLHWYEHTPVN
jgi:hypothetical protein